MSRERTYPVPLRIQAQSTVLGSSVTMSELDLLIQSGVGTQPERDWAINVRNTFVRQVLDKVCESRQLPRGVVAEVNDIDVVVGLIAGGQVWNGEWHDRREYEIIREDDVMLLTEDEVAFTIDAVLGGAQGLALKPLCPRAFLDHPVTAAPPAPVTGISQTPSPLPDGAKILAVVDDTDRTAVLDLIAVAPGPVVYRRNDGQWYQDDNWIRALRSVKPPPVVSLTDPQIIAAVTAQVDAATKGVSVSQDDDEPVSASGIDHYDHRLYEMQVEWLLQSARPHPITAASVRSLVTPPRGAPGVSAPGGGMPLKLKKYWLFGRGAAKIRWGTPGAMRRCHRHLMKYVGDGEAWRTCNNISKEIGGKGIAWDVEHGVKKAGRAIARAVGGKK